MHCEADHCAERQHLNDDLRRLTLSDATIRDAPFELWPRVVRRASPPADLERLLPGKLDNDT